MNNEKNYIKEKLLFDLSIYYTIKLSNIDVLLKGIIESNLEMCFDWKKRTEHSKN